MAITAVDIDETKDYVLKNDRNSEKPTIWKIGNIDTITLSKIETTEVEWSSEGVSKFQANIFGRELLYVKYGLKGWENFKNKAGDDIKISFNDVSRCGRIVREVVEKSLTQIPAFAIKELAEAIRDLNKLTESETKN